MREFYFDPKARRAMLNGKPYFMRGSNISLYRFFEDAERGSLPWNDEWVRNLHRRIKDMNWNSLRYCIGQPPERWYEIADEEGILIQNEFPIWYAKDIPEQITTDELAAQFSQWMRDHWNHACVVIWDACNETKSQRVADAITRVRGLDLSNRPWDNAYSAPQMPGDVSEQHVYHYNWRPGFRPKTLGKLDYSTDGALGANKHAVIVNEYGWLWVNRDGTPTDLTDRWYRMALGKSMTPANLFRTQALWLAADTEFWRAHRHVAGLLHFTALSYSNPPHGLTADNWIKGGVAKLEWEPEFYKYVRDAFSPVGLMLNLSFDKAQAGVKSEIPLILINDLEVAWMGPVTLRLKSGERVIFEKSQDATIEPFGTANIVFAVNWPEQIGPYVMEAELKRATEPVRSVRDLTITHNPASIAEHCKVSASSVLQEEYNAERATDGVEATYWSSSKQDDAWLAVDLGQPKEISRVDVVWEGAFAKSFSVEISMDGVKWSEIYKTDSGKGGTTVIRFAPATAQRVRLNCTKRATEHGHAVREIEVFQ
jgi:hypothetical protein